MVPETKKKKTRSQVKCYFDALYFQLGVNAAWTSLTRLGLELLLVSREDVFTSEKSKEIKSNIANDL